MNNQPMARPSTFQEFGDIESLVSSTVAAGEGEPRIESNETGQNCKVPLSDNLEEQLFDWRSTNLSQTLKEISEAGEDPNQKDEDKKKTKKKANLVNESFAVQMQTFREQDDWCICRSVRLDSNQINIPFRKSTFCFF